MTTSTPKRLRRSQLFAPGSSEKMMGKAAALAVDQVTLDLEDAVAPSQKAEARRKGSKMVVCVRFETTTIASGWAPAMEVFAYGTALVPDDDSLRLPDARPGVSRLLGDGLVRPRS